MSRKTDSTGEGKGKAPRSQERGAVSVHGKTIETEWENLGEEKPKRGRPTIYNDELAALICSLLAEGHSLRKICKLPDMPHLSTVMQWLFKPSIYRDSFIEQYRMSRQMQAEIHADEMIDIADDSSEDDLFTETDDASGKSARPVLNKEFFQRSKLRVETRQWIASRLLPKVYGAKSEQAEPPRPQRTIRVLKAEDIQKGA